MDDLQLIFYVIVGAIALISRILKHKGPKEEKEKVEELKDEKPEDMEKLLEDLLGMPMDEKKEEPQLVAEVSNEFQTDTDNFFIKDREVLEKNVELSDSEYENSSGLRQLNDRKAVIERSKTSNSYARAFKSKSKLKEAFVMQEVLKRKF
ncbi:hypothetical protein [Aureibacter tunicatorum]|uniref:Uncharacterized protein n=1 Tax=Aureibacter tunicatorum TaxID=866807 RepID=A0AAE4BSL4_9BACT|nr:hypothetical protein [Aureibacter tunicatorum]MDR6238975.1 hypothetical protein [Aureibacter tunicatorum]BDD05099.1 hypothetical protein AUTU_25820 [Aureibacter tunicatorum]